MTSEGLGHEPLDRRPDGLAWTRLPPPDAAVEVAATVVRLLRLHLGERVVAVYVYGSATHGTFRAGKSDLDIGAVVRGRSADDDALISEIESATMAAHGRTISKLDLKLYEIDFLLTDGRSGGDRVVLLTEAELIDGTDVLSGVPLPDEREMLRALADEKQLSIEVVGSSLDDSSDVSRLGRQVAKQVVRLSFYASVLLGETSFTPVFGEMRQRATSSGHAAIAAAAQWAAELVDRPPTELNQLRITYGDALTRVLRVRRATSL